MKKKGIGIALVSVIVLALLLLAGFILGNRQKVYSTGNIADITWYDENGTEFTITTAQELYDIATLSSFYNFEGQTFKLGADIVVNQGNAQDWAKKAPVNNWYPITDFAGTFDGQGHTISGIYGKGNDTPMALFSDTRTRSVIRDFRLINSYFETFGGSGTAGIASNVSGKFEKIYSDAILYCDGEYCGGLFSQIIGETSISECWFDGSVTLTGRTGGGIVDASVLGRVSITNCLNSGSIDSKFNLGGAKVGGIIGVLEKSGADLMLSDSLSVGKITTENMYYVGSVLAVGYNGSTAKISKTYASMDAYDQGIGRSGIQGTFTGNVLELQGKSLVGDDGYRWTDLDFETYWTTVDNSTPILQCFADNIQSVSGLTKAFDTKWYDASKTECTIQTLEELYGFYMLSAENDFKGKTIKLGTDIVVNEGKASEWAKTEPQNTWYPILTFAGTFDGQGHTISGLYLSNSKQLSGFFSQTTMDSTVKNFKVKNSYFSHNSTSDAIIGSIAGRGNGTYENIYSNAIVTSSGSVNGGLIGQVNANAKNAIRSAWFDGELILTSQTGRYGGGIVGTVAKGSTTIEHCLSTGKVSCEAIKTGLHVGGLIGAAMNETTKLQVNDCLYVGEVETDYHVCVGSILGRNNKANVTIQNTYATTESYQHPDQDSLGIGTESKGTLTGGVADFPKAWLTGFGGYEWTTLDFDNSWAVVKNGTPTLKVFATDVPSVAGRSKKIDVSWYKDEAKSYVIDSVKDLYGLYIISANTDFAGKTVKLGKNLVINEGNASEWTSKAPTLTWIPLKTFAGTFEGQGHSISGIYVSDSMKKVGFFKETTKDSIVKNFRLDNAFVTCTQEGSVMVGSVAGRGNGTFDTVYSNAIVTTNANGAGGLIGQINAVAKNKITNCWFDGSVVMTGEGRYAGGIVANVVRGTTTIEHCLNTGTITAEAKDTGMHIGGICATTMNKDTILNIKDCLNTGKVKLNYHVCVGSIMGRVVDGTVNITDTYATTESYVHPNYGFLGIGTNSKGVSLGNAVNFNSSDLKGVKAYQRTTLDFNKYWAALSDNTPQLKSFVGSGLDVTGQAKLYDISWYDAKANTYILDSVEDLFGFYSISATTDFAGKTVQLGANISVNSGDASTWSETAPSKNWYPIKKFAGTFDGKGHTISGIYASSDSQYMGLFAETTETANVKNFKLTNSYFSNTITGYVYMGSIAGRGNGVFENIYSDAMVTSPGSVVGGLIGQINNNGNNNVSKCCFAGTLHQTAETSTYGGGLVGVIARGNTTIENCLVSGTIKSEAVNLGLHFGGMLGAIQNKDTVVNVKHSLNSGVLDVDYHVCVGSILGRSQKGTLNLEDTFAIKESYKQTIGSNSSGTHNGSVTIVPKAYFTGTLSYQFSAFDFKDIWSAEENKTPELKNFASGTAVSTKGLDRADTSWYDASKDTYKIYNAADLYGVAKLSLSTDFKGKTILVKKNVIDTKNNLWMPIGAEKAFAGTFDGELNTIKGINVNTDQSFIGLFGQVSGTVKNLRLEDSTITSTYGYEYGYVGGVAGFLTGNLENVYSSADVVSQSKVCGGLIGRFGGNSSAKIMGCWFDGTVTSSSQIVGGIVGEVHMGTKTISNCLSTGTVVSTWNTTNFPHVGGICGNVTQPDQGRIACLNLDNSLSVAKINAVGTSTVGAVVGRFGGSGELVSTGTITNVYTTDGCYSEAISSNTQGVITDSNVKISSSHFTRIAEDYLKGYFGYQLTEFDFDNTWVAIKDGTPELKLFAKGDILRNLNGLHRADTSWIQDNTGNEDDPYQIKNVADLYGLSKLTLNGNGFAGKYIKLTGETDNFVVNENINNPKNMWIPIGNSTKANFSGHFDGNGHTISGIYCTGTANVGLFGVTTYNSVIRNFELDNSYFYNSGYCTGAIAGVAGGKFEKIYVHSNVLIHTDNTVTGGVVGRVTTKSDKNLITECWFAGTIETSKEVAGGIAANVFNGSLTIENCLYSGTITSTSIQVGGISFGASVNNNTASLSVKNCVSVGDITASNYARVGSVLGCVYANTTVEVSNSYATAKSNYGTYTYSGGDQSNIKPKTTNLLGAQARYNTALDFYFSESEEGIWVAREGKTPVLKSFVPKSEWYTADEAIVADTTWYNANSSSFTITTVAELYGFSKLVTDKTTNFYGKIVYLGADILVNQGDAKTWGTKAPLNAWTPIGHSGMNFNGTFDGNGHTISGIYCTGTANVGLFGVTTYNSVIKNFELDNSYFYNSGYYTGAIAGLAGGKYEKIYVHSNVLIDTDNLVTGGIVGRVNTKSDKNIITECWFAGTIETSKEIVGGIAANVFNGSLRIENCLFSGKIDSSYIQIGGICFGATVNNNTASLTIKDCVSVGDITASNYARVGSVLGCMYASTTVEVSNTYAIAKTNYGTYTYSGGDKTKITPEVVTFNGTAPSGLNTTTYWSIVPNSYPILKYFE